MSYRIWLPVRAGEMGMYKFAYFNIGDIDDEFPEPYDWVTGNGVGSPIIRDFSQGDTGNRVGQGGGQSFEPYKSTLTLNPYPRLPRIHDDKDQDQMLTGPHTQPIFPEIDPGVQSDYVPKDLSQEPPAEYVPEETTAVPDYVTNPTLSLHGTLIHDARSGSATPLGAFFTRVDGGDLVIRDRIVIEDADEHTAPFTFKYDELRKEYGAKLAFLAEEHEPEE
jgi:hypothetical protein